MRLSVVCLLVLCIALAGCETQGAFIEEEEAAAMQASIVSAEELVAKLGPPSVTIPRSDGKTLWVYEGVYTEAGATSYLPYVNLLIGMNTQKCTRLTVLVDGYDGALSEWEYVTAEDIDYWAKTDDKCDRE